MYMFCHITTRFGDKEMSCFYIKKDLQNVTMPIKVYLQKIHDKYPFVVGIEVSCTISSFRFFFYSIISFYFTFIVKVNLISC